MSVMGSETYLSNSHAYLRCLPLSQQGRHLGLDLRQTPECLSLRQISEFWMYVQVYLSSEKEMSNHKNEDVTHRLTAYVWLLPIKAAERIAYVHSTGLDYILSDYILVCQNMGWIKKKHNKTRHNTAKKTNQPTPKYQKTQRLSESSPIHLLYVWVLAKYLLLF